MWRFTRVFGGVVRLSSAATTHATLSRGIVAGIAGFGALTLIPTSCAHADTTTSPSATGNRVLSDRHRVGLCYWPIEGGILRGDRRAESLDAIFKHVKAAGYDGVELSTDDIKHLFPAQCGKMSQEQVADLMRNTAERNGTRVLGCLYIIPEGGTGPRPDKPCDLDCLAPDFAERARKRFAANKRAGAEYVTFQIDLRKEFYGTKGAYRGDIDYYAHCVKTITTLRGVCEEVGINMYVETHINRISEDPIAFCDIAKLCEAAGAPFEVNGDLSHYIYTGLDADYAPVADILGRVGHMHVRMARTHGDLSVSVDDPIKDWEQGGVTKTAFEFGLRALAGGLSSRVICGESGPIHLCQNTLDNDAKMVPLMRAMARVADGEPYTGANPFTASAKNQS